MDILDLAKQQEEFALQASLANHRQGAPGESARLCCECEVEIPEGRRLAVPGCQRCVACQQEFEHGELWP